MLKNILALLLCLSLAPAFAADDELAVFTLRSKPPQELVPVLRPMLGEQAAISAFGDKLIVRAPAARLEEIRYLISQLDRPARNLMIEVRVDRHDYAEDQQLRARGRLDNSELSGNLRIHRAGTRGRGDSAQTLRTLEGRAALISVGQSVPVYQVEQSHSPYGDSTQRFSVDYRNVQRGVYVLPRLQGEQVTLEVYQQDERAGRKPGHFDIQHASAVVSGRLGEWIALGSIDSQGSANRDGLGLHGSTRRADQRHISVRVSEISR